MFIRLWPGVGRVQVLGSKKTEDGEDQFFWSLLDSTLLKIEIESSLKNTLLNVLLYEQASYKYYEKPKNVHSTGHTAKIFCDLYKGIP